MSSLEQPYVSGKYEFDQERRNARMVDAYAGGRHKAESSSWSDAAQDPRGRGTGRLRLQSTLLKVENVLYGIDRGHERTSGKRHVDLTGVDDSTLNN